MKRKTVITSVCLIGLLWVGCQKNLNTPAALSSTTSGDIKPATESDNTGQTVAAAKAFLATLDDAGRAKVTFPFDGDQKSKWSNFPVGIYPRNGLRWGDLTASQRDAEMKLLATVLSGPGLRKLKEIMEGDEVLKKTDPGLGPNGPPPGEPRTSPSGPPQGPRPGAPQTRRLGPGMDPGFGHDNYFIAILGTPSLTQPWMIQFGGHHLAP